MGIVNSVEIGANSRVVLRPYVSIDSYGLDFAPTSINDIIEFISHIQVSSYINITPRKTLGKNNGWVYNTSPHTNTIAITTSELWSSPFMSYLDFFIKTRMKHYLNEKEVMSSFDLNTYLGENEYALDHFMRNSGSVSSIDINPFDLFVYTNQKETGASYMKMYLGIRLRALSYTNSVVNGVYNQLEGIFEYFNDQLPAVVADKLLALNGEHYSAYMKDIIYANNNPHIARMPL